MISMKNVFLFIGIFFTLLSCNNEEKGPDVSDVSINLSVNRFDKEFFNIDSSNVLPGLNLLQAKYPLFTSIFLQNILGLDSANTLAGVKRFIHLSQSVRDTVNAVFKNFDDIEKDFKKAFQYTRYYFPQYKLPNNLITIIGPPDALAQNGNLLTPNFLGPDFLGVSLQFYVGSNYSLYNQLFFIENVAPTFRSRRFSKEYMVSDGMQLIVDDLFPDKSAGKPLVEQMVERGKQWWLLKKFLPASPDSIITGYTKNQMEWCNTNEGLIWSYIVKNEDLYSVNPATIQTYLGEAPFTQGFSQELSPGNIGQWIGWKIVEKYAQKNESNSLTDVMNASAKQILDGAKYKPK